LRALCLLRGLIVLELVRLWRLRPANAKTEALEIVVQAKRRLADEYAEALV
jgi:hypothetical protein